VNVKLKCKVVLKQPSDSTIEYILLELPNKSHGRTLLGCIYRPNRTIDYRSLLNVVSDISLEYTDIMLAGDFNSNLLSESHLVDNFKSLGLFSVNETIPTHYSSHCDTLLDLFLINDPRKILHYDQVSVPAFSGHDLIFLTYDLSFDSKINSFTYRDYKNINYN